MANRTTAAEVKQIMENCTVSDAIVTTLINSANTIVTQVFSDDTDIGDTLLEEIERWLTAHMLASSLSRTTSEEKLGDASVKYTGQWGKKLESTPYGQMCLTLDFTGKMGKIGKMAASIYAVESFDN
jgi:hypothetical protein